ncbi:hypothetical protein [Aureivirga sp. CE67]|uniref:hypothetical protein n=1 Tax=Aureivirga sp. CE67 TaxID=1788983 RepID=UPI0018CB6B17|nr:hypothetical protein [Aureivirga sp. CE67]
MKISLNKIIEKGDISPFKWGDSIEDILVIFPEWRNEFENQKQDNYPFFHIDSIEFYFEENDFRKLSNIIIGVWHFDKDYKSNYFDIDWLKDDLSIPQVKKILNDKKWRYEVLIHPRSEEPYILPNRFTEFAFDSTGYGDYKEEMTYLQKIYVNSKPLSEEYLHKIGNKITLYNKI